MICAYIYSRSCDRDYRPDDASAAAGRGCLKCCLAVGCLVRRDSLTRRRNLIILMALKCCERSCYVNDIADGRGL